ncbi:hypothetical protein V8E53_006331 [Lactarius tabidus]
MPLRTAYPPQVTTEISFRSRGGVASAAGLSDNISPPAPSCLCSDPGLSPITVTKDQVGTKDESAGSIVTMPQTITQGQQQQDKGDPDADLPSGVTAVVTSTIMVQPSPSLNQGPNNQGNNGQSPGPPPGQNKTGLQPPPALMQWVQSMLVNIVWAWMLISQGWRSVWGSRWIGRLVGRKADEKPSGDEKPANSQDGDAPADAPGESDEAASTTVSAADGSGGERLKSFYNFVIRLTQFKYPPMAQGSSC